MDLLFCDKLMQVRNELKNIRKQQSALKMSFKHELEKLQRCLLDFKASGIPEKHFVQTSISETGESSSMIQRQSSQTLAEEMLEKNYYQFEPIGHIESMFKRKNGVPRQPGICEGIRSKLLLSHRNFSNPHHLLIGLEDFSHVWIIFVFHKNRAGFSSSKVKPPRLDGRKVGVFATRSPYRPNAIGLTLARIDKIQDNAIHLLGADLLDETPVLDIKPYIPEYDNTGLNMMTPSLSQQFLDGFSHSRVLSSSTAYIDERHQPEDYKYEFHISEAEVDKETSCLALDCTSIQVNSTEQNDVEGCSGKHILHTQNDDIGFEMQDDFMEAKISTFHSLLSYFGDCYTDSEQIRVAEWIRNPPIQKVTVFFTCRAASQLKQFSSSAEDVRYKMCFFKTAQELKTALTSILSADPRSVYRRKQCSDRLYFLTLDVVHVSCWFDDSIVEVVKVSPVDELPRIKNH